MQKSKLFTVALLSCISSIALADESTVVDCVVKNSIHKTSYQLKKQDFGTYSLITFDSGNDRSTGERIEFQEVLQSELTCQVNGNQSPSIFQCSLDKRPVDGGLIEFKMTKNSGSSTYTLVQKTTDLNRLSGIQKETTHTFSERLACRKLNSDS